MKQPAAALARQDAARNTTYPAARANKG